MKCSGCGKDVGDPGFDVGSVTCDDCHIKAPAEKCGNEPDSSDRLAKISEGLQSTFCLFAKDYSMLMGACSGDSHNAASRLAGAMAGLAAVQATLEMARIAKENL